MPAAATPSPMLTVFSDGNGVPPTSGINLIYNNAAGGPIDHVLADGNFAFLGAQCAPAMDRLVLRRSQCRRC